MAISEKCPKNTATVMLAHNRKWIKNNFKDIALLVSYQDVEVHLGTIYKADNWVNSNRTKGISWTNETRNRNIEQSLADKVRWEYKLNDYKNTDDAAQIRSTYKPSDFIVKALLEFPDYSNIIKGEIE